jgi:hypothetical protein
MSSRRIGAVEYAQHARFRCRIGGGLRHLALRVHLSAVYGQPEAAKQEYAEGKGYYDARLSNLIFSFSSRYSHDQYKMTP